MCACVFAYIYSKGCIFLTRWSLTRLSFTLQSECGGRAVTRGRDAAMLTGCRWRPPDRLPHQQPPAPPRALRAKIASIMLLRVHANCSGHFLAGCFLNLLNCPCARCLFSHGSPASSVLRPEAAHFLESVYFCFERLKEFGTERRAADHRDCSHECVTSVSSSFNDKK